MEKIPFFISPPYLRHHNTFNVVRSVVPLVRQTQLPLTQRIPTFTYDASSPATPCVSHQVPVMTAFLSSTLNTTATSEFSPSSCRITWGRTGASEASQLPPKGRQGSGPNIQACSVTGYLPRRTCLQATTSPLVRLALRDGHRIRRGLPRATDDVSGPLWNREGPGHMHQPRVR